MWYKSFGSGQKIRCFGFYFIRASDLLVILFFFRLIHLTSSQPFHNIPSSAPFKLNNYLQYSIQLYICFYIICNTRTINQQQIETNWTFIHYIQLHFCSEKSLSSEEFARGKFNFHTSSKYGTGYSHIGARNSRQNRPEYTKKHHQEPQATLRSDFGL